MLAATGVLWVEIFGPLPGWPVADGRSQMDVFWDAFDEHPNAIAAGLLFITIIEAISGVATTMGRETGERAPGDFGFNPLKFEVTEAMALKEVKNGRLAMWAVMGMIFQGTNTHEPIFDNLGKIVDYVQEDVDATLDKFFHDIGDTDGSITWEKFSEWNRDNTFDDFVKKALRDHI